MGGLKEVIAVRPGCNPVSIQWSELRAVMGRNFVSFYKTKQDWVVRTGLNLGFAITSPQTNRITYGNDCNPDSGP
jgi:hypothetical protein